MVRLDITWQYSHSKEKVLQQSSKFYRPGPSSNYGRQNQSMKWRTNKVAESSHINVDTSTFFSPWIARILLVLNIVRRLWISLILMVSDDCFQFVDITIFNGTGPLLYALGYHQLELYGISIFCSWMLRILIVREYFYVHRYHSFEWYGAALFSS